MSNVINLLVSAIKGRVQANLGSSYSELAHQIDISQNKFRGSANKYGVLPADINEISGATGAVTVDQSFSIYITDQFIPSDLHDESRRNKAIILMDNALAVYNDLVKTKCGLSQAVMNVKNLTVDAPEYLDDGVVYVRLRFSVTIRKLI